MPSRIELTAALVEQLRAEMRDASPNECCGLIEGERDEQVWRVTELYSARNLAPTSDRFAINPRDQFVAAKAARANGRAIIGCYHSHPGGQAQPSATDLAGADEDNFLWLIVTRDALGAFVYLRGTFTEADWVMSSE